MADSEDKQKSIKHVFKSWQHILKGHSNSCKKINQNHHGKQERKKNQTNDKQQTVYKTQHVIDWLIHHCLVFKATFNTIVPFRPFLL